MGFKYSKICQKMQMKITGILLQDIYITPDSRFQMAQILVRKGKAVRFRGISGLRECIQCLSEAIAIMVSLLVLLFSLKYLSSLMCKIFYVGDVRAINMM